MLADEVCTMSVCWFHKCTREGTSLQGTVLKHSASLPKRAYALLSHALTRCSSDGSTEHATGLLALRLLAEDRVARDPVPREQGADLAARAGETRVRRRSESGQQ